MDPRSIHAWVAHHADRTPQAPAVATPTTRLTYGELDDLVRGLAASLAAGGVGHGDRVVIALANSIAMVVAGLAVQSVGAIPVEIARELGQPALERVVERSRPVAVIVADRDVARWGALAMDPPWRAAWVVTADATAAVPAVGQATTVALGIDGQLRSADQGLATGSRPGGGPGGSGDPDPDAPAVVLFTSGSTGEPHGVVQTYRNIETNTRSIIGYLGLTADDRALLTLPLHYCYGRSVLQTHLTVGGSVMLDHRFAFPVVVMDALAAEGATGFAGVPLTFEILRRQVDVASLSFERLRYLTQAGGAMADDTIGWVREAFAPAELYVMYGQTEATARLSYLPPARAADKRGSIGVPIPGVTIDIVDEAARPVAAGTTGELVARGDNITPGYLDEPEATAAILHDGWLWTGDLAYRDEEGFLFLQGRSKDILKVGGHRISPVEIEHVVTAHPAVAEAAVIGIPDPLFGEVPLAVIVLREPGSAVPEDGLREHCRAGLPAFAVPVRFEVTDRLPRNAAGKLQRAEVQARYGVRG